ncbi:MAG: YMGG-like glycine zipper-containing protein, partial [Opitutaceae bacterium]
MKTILALLIAASVALPARAQLFRPEAVNGAAVGALAGAIIGHNSGDLHHNGWQGAAIGAGAGMLLGSAFGDAHRDGIYYRAHVASPRGYGFHGPSYGYRGYRRGPGYFYSYGPRYTTGYYSPYTYYVGPSYANSGAFFGGLVGAIIGHNSGGRHNNGWRGAAIGAGAGLLLGSIADSYAGTDTLIESPTVVETVPVATHSAPAQAAPQNVTIINNYYNGA